MPTKKTTKKTVKQTSSFDIQKLIDGSDSYKSLIYGIVTVVVLFIVIALGIRTLQQNKAQIDDEALSTSELDLSGGGTHVVTEGETLWSIAEKEYGDGFMWDEIARENSISDATTLEEGTKLALPEKEESKVADATIAISPAISATPTVIPVKTTIETEKVAVNQKISGTNYKIVEGDTLWDISIKAYGDGYRWVEIAQFNKLANPDLIYTGDTLILSRP